MRRLMPTAKTTLHPAYVYLRRLSEGSCRMTRN